MPRTHASKKRSPSPSRAAAGDARGGTRHRTDADADAADAVMGDAPRALARDATFDVDGQVIAGVQAGMDSLRETVAAKLGPAPAGPDAYKHELAATVAGLTVAAAFADVQYKESSSCTLATQLALRNILRSERASVAIAADTLQRMFGAQVSPTYMDQLLKELVPAYTRTADIMARAPRAAPPPVASESDFSASAPSDSESDVAPDASSDGVSADATAPDAAGEGAPTARAARAAARAAVRAPAAPSVDVLPDGCMLPGCENFIGKKLFASKGGDFCEDCKRGTILCGVKHVYRPGGGGVYGLAAWRLSAPAPANPALRLADARATLLPGRLEGYHGYLNLAKPVPVEVRSFHKEANELLLRGYYGLAGYDRPLDVAVQLDDPRLVLTEPPKPKPPPKSIPLSLPAHDVVITQGDIEAAVANPELHGYTPGAVARAVVWERTADVAKLRERCEEMKRALPRWKELFLPVLKDGRLPYVSETQPGFLREIIRSSKPIKCQVGCGEMGVQVAPKIWLPVCQYHYNPLILRRHPDTGALSAESWPLCYDCVTRRRLDEFVVGKRAFYGGFTLSCDTCLASKREDGALEAAEAKPKPIATAAIKKRVTGATDKKVAAHTKAAELITDHWGKQTFTSALKAFDWFYDLAEKEGESSSVARTVGHMAAAKFESEKGGGSADG